MDDEEKKWRAKQVLLSKLKDLDTMKQQKVQPTPPMSHQTRNPLPKIEPNHKGAMRVDTEEDFKKMPYEGKAKYDNQLKALNALKSQNPQIAQKPKKMFFEHYDTSEPYCPNIPNNPNPSGRPPNIPPQMYEGITVKPKRPWVYLGTQNLPPVEYQEINDRNFKQIQRKHFEEKKEGGDKPKGEGRKKKAKKEQQDGSDEFNSNFEMSDEMEMSGESMLVSDYKSQSKQSKSKGQRSKMGKQSSFAYEDDDDIMSEGVETKKKMGNMFEDMDSDSDMQMEDESSQVKSKGAGSKKNVKQSKGQSYSRGQGDSSD